ncbi:MULTISPECIES: ATP-binding cassette domain-containing protein [Bacteria]|uniref:ATP-binding cassette domain-containing protein n=1 Tax=Bacteria TaxID=2 RepID=UPI003C7D9E04
MTDGQLLEFSRATKRFGALTAVDDLSAQIAPGAVTGFLGPNGAGKTTSLRMLLGLIRPTSGTATIGGTPYADLRHPLRTVGSVMEEALYRPRRTAARQLAIAAKANGIPLARVDEVVSLVGLQNEAETRIGAYSLGMRQRLSIATALLGDPGALVLDEPANGLDPEGIRWMRLLMRRLADEGRTVLVSSHVLSEIEQIADNVLVLARGRLVYADSINKLSDPTNGSVVVDAEDRDALIAALTQAGLAYDVLRIGLSVHDTDAATVGALAASSGIALRTLQQRGPTLEEVFLDLVHGRRDPVAGAPFDATVAMPTVAADAETGTGVRAGAAVAGAAAAGAAVAGAAAAGAAGLLPGPDDAGELSPRRAARAQAEAARHPAGAPAADGHADAAMAEDATGAAPVTEEATPIEEEATTSDEGSANDGARSTDTLASDADTATEDTGADAEAGAEEAGADPVAESNASVTAVAASATDDHGAEDAPEGIGALAGTAREDVEPADEEDSRTEDVEPADHTADEDDTSLGNDPATHDPSAHVPDGLEPQEAGPIEEEATEESPAHEPAANAESADPSSSTVTDEEAAEESPWDADTGDTGDAAAAEGRVAEEPRDEQAADEESGGEAPGVALTAPIATDEDFGLATGETSEGDGQADEPRPVTAPTSLLFATPAPAAPEEDEGSGVLPFATEAVSLPPADTTPRFDDLVWGPAATASTDAAAEIARVDRQGESNATPAEHTGEAAPAETTRQAGEGHALPAESTEAGDHDGRAEHSQAIDDRHVFEPDPATAVFEVPSPDLIADRDDAPVEPSTETTEIAGIEIFAPLADGQTQEIQVILEQPHEDDHGDDEVTRGEDPRAAAVSASLAAAARAYYSDDAPAYAPSDAPVAHAEPATPGSDDAGAERAEASDVEPAPEDERPAQAAPSHGDTAAESEGPADGAPEDEGQEAQGHDHGAPHSEGYRRG